MTIDVKKIVDTFERKFKNKNYLFVPCDTSDKLLVLLSAHNQKNNYFLLRTFLENQRCNLLFLTDPCNTWYLDSDRGQVYVDLLDFVFKDFVNKNIFIFGSSMAGYAALHFSVIKNVNCLSCNPQVNLDLSLDYGWHELNRNMKKVISSGSAVPVERLLNNTYYEGVMCIVHGHAPIDVANVEIILGSSTPVRKLLVLTIDSDDHAMPFGRDVEKIYEIIDLMSRYSDFSLVYPDQNPQIGVLRENRKSAIRNGLQHNFRCLARSEKDVFFWRNRHEIEKPGVFYFDDIGYYNSKGEISGSLVFYDGDLFRPLVNSRWVTNRFDFSFANELVSEIKNNQIFGDFWFRVPVLESVVYVGDSVFDARYQGSKNCFLNWEIARFLKGGLVEGQSVSCFIDVEIDVGCVTLSLGACGSAGYYQANKVIDKTGSYCLVFQPDNIDFSHRDSLFLRLYFYPDGVSKSVRINKMSVAHGFLPTVDFF